MLGNLLHRRVELRARDPGELGEYYGSVWGFDVEESRGVWSVRAGSTELVFAPATDDTDPFYHFAFNIPEHRFVDAKQWLSQRGPLLTDSDSGADDREFTTWDAHGCYVSDPARNIVELIARHTRPYEYDDPFTVAAIEGVSEVGLRYPINARPRSSSSRSSDWLGIATAPLRWEMSEGSSCFPKSVTRGSRSAPRRLRCFPCTSSWRASQFVPVAWSCRAPGTSSSLADQIQLLLRQQQLASGLGPPTRCQGSLTRTCNRSSRNAKHPDMPGRTYPR